jgi:hypothetical protein
VDEQEVFSYLQKQKKAVLLGYLRAAFGAMNAEQRRAVFADAVRKPPQAAVDGEQLWGEIDQFRRDSLARQYYAPFNMDSRNWRHIPEKTREWCHRFAGFAEGASRLSARGDHAQAIRSFGVLYELLGDMEMGREIVFAEEVGSWLIPGDQKAWLKAYLTSLAAAATPEQFTQAVIPLLERDSIQSFSNQAYASALRVANKEQKAHLRAEVQRRDIRTGPRD